MARPPKTDTLALYRTEPDHPGGTPGWATCHKATGYARRISDAEAERLMAAAADEKGA